MHHHYSFVVEVADVVVADVVVADTTGERDAAAFESHAASSPFSFARVFGPTYPSAGSLLTVRLYLSWNFATAAFVSGPKKVVSRPGDPSPSDAIAVSESPLRTT